jgi:hypothetical protein
MSYIPRIYLAIDTHKEAFQQQIAQIAQDKK